MSQAYDDSRYLARTLAITLLDLTSPERNEILRYLQEELERVSHVEEKFQSDKGEAQA